MGQTNSLKEDRFESSLPQNNKVVFKKKINKAVSLKADSH